MLSNVNQQNTPFQINVFNSILIVFYMFRTFCVHHDEGFIVHAALYGMFS